LSRHVNEEDERPHRSAQIVIADDHPLMRSALRSLLEAQPELKVVGEAANGREALELCRRLRPQLVLMDLRMPEMDGIQATHAIKQELPSTIVVVITVFADERYLSEALTAGATGYILKAASPQEIVNAIRVALKGECAIHRDLSVKLLCQMLEGEEPATISSSSAMNFEEGHSQAPLLEALTPREVEVSRWLARGQTNKEIAHKMLVSVSTIKKHVHSIISKLEVSDRTQAAIKARELGLLANNQAEE
jgi:DNA-binding NarL/FixJ family response regulator